jgi:hypothetical protein
LIKNKNKNFPLVTGSVLDLDSLSPDPAFKAKYGSGSGSRVLRTKKWETITAGEKIQIFMIKNFNLLILRPH